MKKFPYRDEDLVTKEEFINLCISKWYKIDDRFFQFLKDEEMLSPVDNKQHYSGFQFYLIADILENRYDNYFYRIQLTYEKNHSWFLEKATKHIKEYDKKYKEEIYPLFVDFFNLYYTILEDYENFYSQYQDTLYNLAIKDGTKDLEKRIWKLHASQNIEKGLRNKTISRIPALQKNKKIIHYFMDRYRYKYENYIAIYDSLKEHPNISKIPEFQLVTDFVSKILIVIEWYFNTNNIPYKRKMFWKVKLSDSSCAVCWAFYSRKNITQITCSKSCSNKRKNMLKRQKRLIDKSYGA